MHCLLILDIKKTIWVLVLIMFIISGCGMGLCLIDVTSSTGKERSGSASLAINSTLP